jgi:hypothetical protein
MRRQNQKMALPSHERLIYTYSRFFSKGLPKQNFEKKINFREKPIEL